MQKSLEVLLVSKQALQSCHKLLDFKQICILKEHYATF